LFDTKRKRVRAAFAHEHFLFTWAFPKCESAGLSVPKAFGIAVCSVALRIPVGFPLLSLPDVAPKGVMAGMFKGDEEDE
jgi:hypothetical protein